MDLNKAMIIGRLTRDPEIRTTSNGANVASFSLATNLVWKDSAGNKQEKVEYHNIVAWRKLCDICGQYLKKGMKVYIEGRLQTKTWDDKNGSKQYRTEIVADNMIMLESRGANSYENAQPATAPAPVPAPTAAPAPSIPQEEEINIEEIPF